jgi:DNA-binding NarL/FixJ family response regulator
MPQILLVDAHPAVRQGLALVLGAEGIGDCHQACGRAEALDILMRERPDVALVHLSTDDSDTVTLVSELRARRIPVLVCSRHECASYVKRVMAAGAQGYITTDEAPLAVARAVRDVLEGWMLISPRAAECLARDDEAV